MALEKARLTPIHPPGDPVIVLINPGEYTLAKDMNYAQTGIPGLRGPVLQFVSGNLQTLEMELLVDTYEQGSDVREEIAKLFRFMEIDSDTHAPPILEFAWGTLTFTCVLARMTQRFIMFLPSGVPVRARLNVTFNEYLDPEREAKETNRQTADYSKVHQVLQGQTLSSIAYQFYENPALWRPIAIANGIDDPRQIAVGQQLLIPRLPFTDPESGEVMR
ncbi:MAG: LysM peptidoglycan-binding domain-containing protein [Chloroflexi bacterium]|jgi:LysM repeat protein|nr:LysM peptidoglycan-binding domain-containing protein [Chloroflexota bacterium]